MPALPTASLEDVGRRDALPTSSLRAFAQMVTYAIVALALLAAALLMVHEGPDNAARSTGEPPATSSPDSDGALPAGLAWGA